MAPEDLEAVRAVVAGERRWHVITAECLGCLVDFPADSFDALITDPPYSSGGQFRGDRMQNTRSKYVHTGTVLDRPDFTGDNRDQRGFALWCSLWLAECYRILRPGAAACLFTDWRQLPTTTTDVIQAGGFVWRGTAVWDKTEGSRPQMGRFRSQSEYIVHGTKGPQADDLANSIGVLPGVYRYIVPRDDKFHQTGKPTALMKDIVRICPPGGVILDPFAGSGTTIVAALLQGRRGIGFEQTPEIAEIARQRCAAAVENRDWRQPQQIGLLEGTT